MAITKGFEAINISNITHEEYMDIVLSNTIKQCYHLIHHDSLQDDADLHIRIKTYISAVLPITILLSRKSKEDAMRMISDIANDGFHPETAEYLTKFIERMVDDSMKVIYPSFREALDMYKKSKEKEQKNQEE